MLIVTIDNGNGPVNVTNYVVEGSISVTDSINVPTLCTLTLANVDDAFVTPLQSSYLAIYSTKFQRYMFTGFVTNVPEASYLGRSQRVPSTGFVHHQFSVQATSDEWLLNVKTVPFLPAFVGQTMGQILTALADTLAPGFFDTSGIQDGNLVPYLSFDPTQKWSDLAKQFGDAARYRYKVVNRVITFAQFGDAPLGIAYDDTLADSTFDPTQLQSNVLTVPPVNDAIVVGDVEPQTIHDDYFVGDGFTANFPLRHLMFNGSTNSLLEDDWTELAFSSQWDVEDPLGAFLLTSDGVSPVGALNVVSSTGSQVALGTEYIVAQNGIELGGMLTLQHGDFTFVDVGLGIIGGVYDSVSTIVAGGGPLLGFQVFTASGDVVMASPSGATNVALQPVLSGAQVGPVVKTVINHQYVLTTFITARRYTRYQQIYTSLAGTVFGGYDLPALADVVWNIQDINEGDPFVPPIVTQFTLTGVALPSFGVYALINSQYMNLNVNFTLLSQPPQGLLTVAGLTGATGSQLPILPQNLGAPQQVPLGFGMAQQVATIGANTGGDTSILQFYAGQILTAYVPNIGGESVTLIDSTIPAPGARIKLTSWEAAKSLARIQDATAIAAEGVVPGDDGVRTAVFQDLSPLPRTSEECEQAALAQIADRSNPQWQGTYTVFDYFWDGYGADYPTSGRFLYVNSPPRGILRQNLFVNQVTITVVEMHDETIQFEVSFGQDLFLEKLLSRFIPTPQNILEPNDAAVAPTLQFINDVGETFLPDLLNAQLSQVTGRNVTVDLGAPPITGCEVRRADYGWGVSDQNLLGELDAQVFTLPRTAYEQIFYMRQVNGPLVSRFTRAMRVVYPLVPTPPGLAGVTTTDPLHPVIQLQFTGDIRNIRGLEIRAGDNATVLYQQTVLSIADLNYTFDNSEDPEVEITLYAYFFNLLWEYSSPLVINIDMSDEAVLTAFAATAGANLIGNPGFEVATANYATGLALGAGQFLADGWVADSASAPQIEMEVEQDGNQRTGQKNGHIELVPGMAVPNGATISGALLYPSQDFRSGIPVRGGDYYYLGGYTRYDADTSMPSGVSASAFWEMAFYGPYGAPVSSMTTTPLTVTFGVPAVSGGPYIYQDGIVAVPTEAAFINVRAVLSLYNNSGSAFNTGVGHYFDARFDDCLLILANRGTHSSYRPLSNPLTAMDDGSYPEIDVAQFDMQSGNSQVTCNAGTISGAGGGLAYNTLYYVYYDDPGFVGGAVIYHATTIKENAIFGEVRFFVGSITTPLAGGPPTVGNNDGGAGAQSGQVSILSMSIAADSGSHGPGASITNIQSAIDGNLTTYAVLNVSGNTSPTGAIALMNAAAPPGINQRYQSATLMVAAAIPNNSYPSLDGNVAAIYSINAGQTYTSVLFQAVSPTTAPFTIYMAALPTGLNLSQVTVQLSAGAASAASGISQMFLYGVWIEAIS